MSTHPTARQDTAQAASPHAATPHRPSRLGRALAVLGLLLGLGVGGTGLVLLLDDAPDRPVVPAATGPVGTTPLVPPHTEVATPAERVAPPTRIEVPAIGVDEALAPYGLAADGSMLTPPFGEAGWYRPGPRPGEPGAAVVVAHVHGPDGPDVFWDLHTLDVGDVVRVHRRGAVATFVVEAVEDVPKEALPYDRIWPATDESLLRLITCGGKRTAAGYPDNTVVYARLLATSPTR